MSPTCIFFHIIFMIVGYGTDIHDTLRRAFVAYAIRYRKLRNRISTLEKRIATTSVVVRAG